MYLPPFNRVEDDAKARAFVAAVGDAHLVTVGPDGLPDATLLPVLWRGDSVVAHAAIANSHWRRIADGAPGLFVASAARAYVSPSWYAAKAEHHRVVPTWNYAEVQLRGPVRIHRDPEWLLGMVSSLTRHHEADRDRPWAVSDAPEQYVAAQLRGIVGIELRVESVEAKAKASQNRSEADRDGVLGGLADDEGAGRQGSTGAARESLASGTLPTRP